MNIAFLNAVAYGSTGRIVSALADEARRQGHRTLVTSGFTWVKSTRDDFVLTSGIVEKTLHTFLAYHTGKIGTYSRHATRRLLKKLDAFSPDILHLHNLHGWYLNLPMLFDYIREKNIRVIWTLHDCWAFTGHCPHFDACGCEKWKSGCHDCSQHRLYPQSRRDASSEMYENKRRWFSSVKDLTIVTPSRWLAELVKESFLSEYPVCVIPNGIDTTLFSPKKEKAPSPPYNLLGVSYAWNQKKGLDVFCELAETLGDDYRITLVGTDENCEKTLPENVTAIRRTQNAEELVSLYSEAHLFVNPTREENFPTVNLEALSCGTPVLTFCTGGSAEMLNETCGESVPKNDTSRLSERIQYICENNPYPKDACRKRALAFDNATFLSRYLSLYERREDLK